MRLNRRKIIDSIAVLLSGSVIAQGITTITLLVMARQLGAASYGQYAACLAFASFTSIIISLGMDIWLLYRGSQTNDQLGVLLGSILLIKFFFGLLWWTGIYFLSFYLNWLLSSDSFPTELLRLTALVVFLDSLFGTILVAYKVTLHNAMTSVLDVLSDALWLGLTLILIMFGEDNILKYVQVRIIALSIFTLVSLGLVHVKFKLKPNIEVARQILGQIFPFFSSEFLAWTSMRVDILIVASILGSEAVGLYSPIVGIVNALFSIPAAVYTVILPVFSNLFLNNIKQAWLTFVRTMLLLLVLGIGLTLFVFIAGNFLVFLLGESFRGAEDIVFILSPVLLIHSLIFGVAAVLVSTNQQTQRTVVQTIVVVINIVLNVIIAYYFDIRGVAVVYVVTEIILLTGYSWLVLKSRSTFQWSLST